MGHPAFLLAAFSCLLGVMFCLIKSPQARSEAYLSNAAEYLSQGQFQEASYAAVEAVRLNPSAPEGWYMISNMLQQKGNDEAAGKARQIAYRLQQNPTKSSPFYATPADLRFSLLALPEPEFR